MSEWKLRAEGCFGGGDGKSSVCEEKWRAWREQSMFQQWCLVQPGACEAVCNFLRPWLTAVASEWKAAWRLV